MPTLDQLPVGRTARVVALTGGPALTQRLLEFGVLEGETVEMVGAAPMGDPLEIRVANTRLSLRRAEAAAVSVEPAD